MHTNSLVSFDVLARYTEDFDDEHFYAMIGKLLNEKEKKVGWMVQLAAWKLRHLQKLKAVPGNVAIDIKVLGPNWEDPAAGRLNPALFPVNPFPSRPVRVLCRLVPLLSHRRLSALRHGAVVA
jgi:hypothetical protein